MWSGGKRIAEGLCLLWIGAMLVGCAEAEPHLPTRQCIDRLARSSDPAAPSERVDADLREKLSARYRQMERAVQDFATGLEITVDLNSVLSWRESPLLESYLNVFVAERNTALLQRFVNLAEKILAHRDDRRTPQIQDYKGRVRPVWSTTRYSTDKVFSWVVQTGVITYPMARFVEVVRNHPDIASLTLSDGRTAGAVADEMLAAVIESVNAFEDEWNESRGGYYFPADGTFLPAQEGMTYAGLEHPYNQQHSIGRTFAVLARVTGDTRYSRRVQRMVENFRDVLNVDPVNCAYVWKYASGLIGNEDSLHGALTVDFMMEAHQTNGLTTDGELQLMAWTFTKKLRRSIGVTAHIVDGGGEQTPAMAWASYSGWFNLNRYDSLIFEDVRTLFRRTVDENGFGSSSYLFGDPSTNEFLGLSRALLATAGLAP